MQISHPHELNKVFQIRLFRHRDGRFLLFLEFFDFLFSLLQKSRAAAAEKHGSRSRPSRAGGLTLCTVPMRGPLRADSVCLRLLYHTCGGISCKTAPPFRLYGSVYLVFRAAAAEKHGSRSRPSRAGGLTLCTVPMRGPLRADSVCLRTLYHFSPIVIVVDGLASVIQQAEQKAVARLEVFIRLGERIGVTVIGADTAQNVELAYYSQNILMETLHEGPLLLMGGKADDHRIADTQALARQFPDAFAPDQMVLDRGGTFTGIKRMRADG